MPILSDSTASASTVTYADLRTGIDEWLHRSDLQTFSPDFVRLAESDIRNDVRCRAMEAEATGTVVSNSITHPSGLIELIRLVVDGYVYSYVEPREFAELERQESTDYFFTSIGQTFRVLTGTSYSLVYWAPLTELSADSDTNWLLQNAMDVYLWACLKHAAVYAMDDTNTMKFDALYKGAMQRVNAREAKAPMAGGRLMMGTELSFTASSNIFGG